MSFLKRGKKAKAAISLAAEQAEALKNEVRRFFLPRETKTKIIFLDGECDEDGVLIPPMYSEHNVQINGKWGNTFVCVADEGSCPLCEEGLRASLVGLFSIIDRSVYVDKSGKTHKDQLKLFVAKSGTLSQLQAIAEEMDGSLSGLLMTVSRSSEDTAPAVGTTFIPGKRFNVDKILVKFGFEEPINFEEAACYKTEKQLRALGFGTASVGSDQEFDDDLDDDDELTDHELGEKGEQQDDSDDDLM